MTYEYDVCFSFAGEQRPYVDQVAKLLRQRDIRVFYDNFKQADLWGKDLYVHLDEVYRKKARFCVVFASADYARKAWTNHERRSAQARAFESNVEYVLPARFDDTEIPGVPPTIGYIDLRVTEQEQLVELIMEKLGHDPEAAPSFSTAPVTEAEQAQLLALKPRAWEYFLFAGVMVRGKQAHQAQRKDYELGYTREFSTIADGALQDFFLDRGTRLDAIVHDLNRILNPRAQEWAFGPPGVPDNITHLGNRVVDAYADLLAWAAEVRGARPKPRWARVVELFALFADGPIRQLERFIDDYADQVRPIPAVPDEEPVTITMPLTITFTEGVSERFDEELAKVQTM